MYGCFVVHLWVGGSWELILGALRAYLLREVAEGGDNSQTMTASIEVRKAAVASRLSLTPGYFSRVLHALEFAALVHSDKRDVHIRDRLAAWPG